MVLWQWVQTLVRRCIAKIFHLFHIRMDPVKPSHYKGIMTAFDIFQSFHLYPLTDLKLFSLNAK